MRFFRKKKNTEISLEEILLDSSNLPLFDTNRMEGRIELPLSRLNIYSVGVVFTLIVLVFLYKLFQLQIIEGNEYAATSESNRLGKTIIVAERGIILDRNNELVAWNDLDLQGQYDFPVRAYTDRHGLGQLIGYVSYPQKDSAGFYYRTEYEGISGIESAYDELLKGKNGVRLVEENAVGEVISENVVYSPESGNEFILSVDAELSEAMYDLIATSTEANGFRSGAGAIMNIQTGEIIAMTSFPSYDPEILSDGDDREQIIAYNKDNRFPFLNKVIGGLYTPGSIVKPFIAYGALAENIIDPMKIIVSNGSITVPNPYNPENPSVFTDWRAHGKMTMRDAIAYSSNVYFYTIGGGFGGQEGLGITKIDEYMSLFGVGEKTGISLWGELDGVVPSPEWKRVVFDDDWRLGDTYNTSIGQFGFQVTPIQMLRAFAAIGNDGTLVTPSVELGMQGAQKKLNLNLEKLRVVQEGMRRTVIQNGGTARSLERNDVAIAAKSGTAEVGAGNAFVNTWAAGYFPYEDPQYAFILLMEHGPRTNVVGGTKVMGWVFDWIAKNRPQLIGNENQEHKLE